MPLVQLFALTLGVVYLLIGLLGLVPPLLTGSVPGAVGPLTGELLGVFAVNLVHTIVHVLIGLYGLLSYRSFGASQSFALLVGVAYTPVFLLGIISANVATLGGALPLDAADNALHLVTAGSALALFFSTRGTATATGA